MQLSAEPMIQLLSIGRPVFIESDRIALIERAHFHWRNKRSLLPIYFFSFARTNTRFVTFPCICLFCSLPVFNVTTTCDLHNSFSISHIEWAEESSITANRMLFINLRRLADIFRQTLCCLLFEGNRIGKNLSQFALRMNVSGKRPYLINYINRASNHNMHRT